MELEVLEGGGEAMRLAQWVGLLSASLGAWT